MSVVESEEKGGELLYCGSTCWNAVDQKKKPKYSLVSPNLVSLTRLRPFVGVDIRFVATFCAAHHCVALDVKGRCYTWGRNKHGQLGHGDRNERFVPTMVSELSKYKIVRAEVGRNHTVVVDLHCVACGLCLSMVIVDRANFADHLDQLDVYDGQNYAEGRKRPESQPRPAVIGCSLETSMVNVDRSDVANQLDLLDGHGCRAFIEGSQPAAARTSKRTAAQAFETVHGNDNDGGDDAKQQHGEVSGWGRAKGGRRGRC